MLTTPPAKPVSFKDIITTGGMKIVFIIVVAMLVASFSFWGALLALAPTNVSASTESGDYNIEVRDSTVQPVEIIVAHTFPLTTSSGSMEFDVADGVYIVFYNVSVLTAGLDQVFAQDGNLVAPMTHMFSAGSTSDSEVITDTFDIDLAPGKYIVRLESDHPVNLKVTQTYSYQGVMDGMLVLGILSIVLLIGVVITALKKRDAARRSSMVDAFAQAPAPPPQPYYSGGGFPGPAPDITYGATASPAAGGTADAARTSSLEYVPGQFYAEVVCTNCGRPIRNPPVNGFVTCESCGAMGRIY